MGWASFPLEPLMFLNWTPKLTACQIIWRKVYCVTNDAVPTDAGEVVLRSIHPLYSSRANNLFLIVPHRIAREEWRDVVDELKAELRSS